ncbi:MAG TPA: GIY-YIG nuclease family protein [bacterium]|nr:GIY-YIG nuclease family protein [bacterium]
MKGWVYIITNPAMPDRCKVGFSTKDPELRAQELNNTGVPYSYVVEYEVLVENPQKHEQEAHRRLEIKGKHDAKEWFKCSPEEAVLEIRTAIGDDKIIIENYKRIEKEKAEKLIKKQLQEAENIRLQKKRDENLRLQKQKEELERIEKERKKEDEVKKIEMNRLKKENELKIQKEKDEKQEKFEKSELAWSWFAIIGANTGCIYAILNGNIKTLGHLITVLTVFVFSILFVIVLLNKKK